MRRIWCALRGHPYPTETDDEKYRDWIEGREPFAPKTCCSNCGAVLGSHEHGPGWG
jgi:hypothetical protein